MTGGDYRVIINDISAHLKGNKVTEKYGIDRDQVADELNKFKALNSWVKDFTFGSYSIDKGLESNSKNPKFSFDSELVTENKAVEFKLQLVDRNYFDIVDADKLQMQEMWQPS